MSHLNHLLFIDERPLEQSLIRYFQALNLNVIQTSFDEIPSPMTHPLAAIVISSRLIENNSTRIDLLYRQYHTPIVVIGETNRDQDLCIRALEVGADDFLIKPIHPRELIARISTIKRRIEQNDHPLSKSKEMLLFEGWSVNPNARQLFDNQHQEHFISHIAFDLLLAFLRHPHQILDRYYLSTIAQYQQRAGTDRRIDLQISRLRQTLEVDKKRPLIQTIRNKGYMFTVDVESIK